MKILRKNQQQELDFRKFSQILFIFIFIVFFSSSASALGEYHVTSQTGNETLYNVSIEKIPITVGDEMNIFELTLANIIELFNWGSQTSTGDITRYEYDITVWAEFDSLWVSKNQTIGKLQRNVECENSNGNARFCKKGAYKYIMPNVLPIEINGKRIGNLNKIRRGDKREFKVRVRPEGNQTIKIGDNSILITQQLLPVIKARLTNVTFDTEQNYTHLLETGYGLVGYYPFDTLDSVNSNTTILDYSRKKLHGTNGRIIFNLTGSGKYGGAYNFTFPATSCPSSCGVKLTYDQARNFSTSGGYTITGWWNQYEILAGFDGIFVRGNAIGDIVIGPVNGKIRYRPKNASGSAVTLDASFAASAGQWNHFAATYNPNGSMEIYINGYQNKHAILGGIPIDSNLNDYIASDRGLFSTIFNGSLDEIMIFNYSLNTSDVEMLYNRTSDQYKSPAIFAVNGTELRQDFNSLADTGERMTETTTVRLTHENLDVVRNLSSDVNISLGIWNISYGYDKNLLPKTGNIQVYYPLDSDMNDTINGFNITEQLNANDFVDGRYNNSLSLRGNGYGNFSDASNLLDSLVDGYTFSAWIKPNESWAAPPQRIFSAGDSGANVEFTIGLFGGCGNSALACIIMFHDGNVLEGSDTSEVVVSEAWQHVAAVYNQSQGVVGVYYNGNFIENITADSNITGMLADSGNVLGSSYANPGVATLSWNGSIDDLIIWNTDLKPEDIAQVYADGAAKYEISEEQVPAKFNEFNLSTDIKIFTPYYIHYAGNRTSPLYSGALKTQKITIDVFDLIAPEIDFISPTPANSSSQSSPSIFINITTVDNSTRTSVTMDFNGTLAHWWRFNNKSDDPTTGGILKDFTQDANWSNTGGSNFSLESGKFDYGLSFDGSDLMAVNFSQNLSTNMTISMWFKPDKTMSLGTNRMFAFDSNGSLGPNIGISGGKLISFASGGPTGNIESHIGIANELWHQLVFTRYNETPTYELWLDGKSIGTDGGTSLPLGGLIIGGRHNNNASYEGDLDDIQIHNRRLNETEIRASWNGLKNQYYNNFTNLSDSNYTFIAYAQDLNGTINLTQREIQIPTGGGDTTPPNITDLTVHPANNTVHACTATYEFNATVVDDVLVDTVMIQFDGTNYTVVNATGTNIYNFTINNIQAGVYTYVWIANDTSNNLNITQDHHYTIAKQTPTGSLSITPSVDEVYPTTTTATGSETNGCDGDLTYNLFRDNVSVSNPEAILLGVDIYHYLFNATGGTNYSESSNLADDLLNITIGTPVLNLLFNGASEDTTIQNGTFVTVEVNITGAPGSNVFTDSSINLTEASVLINSSAVANITFVDNRTDLGAFIFNGSYTGNMNWSAVFEQFTLTVAGPAGPSVITGFNATDMIIGYNIDSLNQGQGGVIITYAR